MNCEQIRIQLLNVDKLVTNVKQVFKKALYRVLKFYTDAPDRYLPNLFKRVGIRGILL